MRDRVGDWQHIVESSLNEQAMSCDDGWVDIGGVILPSRLLYSHLTICYTLERLLSENAMRRCPRIS